jgi:hypothetical protein
MKPQEQGTTVTPEDGLMILSRAMPAISAAFEGQGDGPASACSSAIVGYGNALLECAHLQRELAEARSVIESINPEQNCLALLDLYREREREAREERDEAMGKLAEEGGSMMACEQKIEDQRALIFELREGIGDIDLWETLVARCNALRTRVAALEEERERLRAYVLSDAECPCCEETEACFDDCTFRADCPDGWERMVAARETLSQPASPAQEARDENLA